MRFLLSVFFFLSYDGIVDVVATIIYIYFFFFQAEDGIRDVAVTGVQTCALPISPLSLLPKATAVDLRIELRGEHVRHIEQQIDRRGLGQQRQRGIARNARLVRSVDAPVADHGGGAERSAAAALEQSAARRQKSEQALHGPPAHNSRSHTTSTGPRAPVGARLTSASIRVSARSSLISPRMKK